MAIAEQTLTKIQSLARLYEAGYSSKTVDATIAKLVDMERSRLQAEADNLLGQMRHFEATYKMTSAAFYRRFQTGELGDDADLFEWSALYQMWVAVESQLQTVRDEHGRSNVPGLDPAVPDDERFRAGRGDRPRNVCGEPGLLSCPLAPAKRRFS